MGRTKGSSNKDKPAEVYTLTPEQRLQIVATLLIEIVVEEQK